MATPQPDYNMQQPFSLFRYRFTSKTENLKEGVPVYQPGPGFVIWEAFMVVETAFDGTTPLADIGFFEVPGVTTGLFATLEAGDTPAAVDLSTASTAVESPAGFAVAAEESARIVMENPSVPDSDVPRTPEMPVLYLIANQTGAPDGDALDSTVGAASLYLLIAEPIDLNVALDQPPLP